MLKVYLDRQGSEKKRGKASSKAGEYQMKRENPRSRSRSRSRPKNNNKNFFSSDTNKEFEAKKQTETFQLINQMKIDQPFWDHLEPKRTEDITKFDIAAHTLIGSKLDNEKEKKVLLFEPDSAEGEGENSESDSFQDCEDCEGCEDCKGPSLSSQIFVAEDPNPSQEEEDEYFDVDIPSIQMPKRKEEPFEEAIEQSQPRPYGTKRRVPSVHRDIVCARCQKQPLIGVRFMCLYCERFNLCEKCERVGHEHLMLRINNSTEEYLYQNLREVYFDISMLEKPKKNRKTKKFSRSKVDHLPETKRPPHNKLKGR